MIPRIRQAFQHWLHRQVTAGGAVAAARKQEWDTEQLVAFDKRMQAWLKWSGHYVPHRRDLGITDRASVSEQRS